MSDLMNKMKCIDELMQNNRLLENEVASLKSELKLKDEKLSEYENGIPIEKADKKKTYLAKLFPETDYYTKVYWSDLDLSWQYLDTDTELWEVARYSTRFYPLPTQTQEGSDE